MYKLKQIAKQTSIGHNLEHNVKYITSNITKMCLST